MARARSFIPVPEAELVDTENATWLVSRWVRGDPGSAWLDTPSRSRALAREMGIRHRAMKSIGHASVSPDAPDNARDARVVEVTWDRLGGQAGAVRDALAILDDRSPLVGFVHGDYALSTSS